MGQEVPLHPILVFRFLVDNDDDVILFESQLVLVVSRAVVQGSTPTPTRGMLLKKTKEYSAIDSVNIVECKRLYSRLFIGRFYGG